MNTIWCSALAFLGHLLYPSSPLPDSDISMECLNPTLRFIPTLTSLLFLGLDGLTFHELPYVAVGREAFWVGWNFYFFLLPLWQSAVTCLLWPAENTIVFGLAEGKVEKLVTYLIFLSMQGLWKPALVLQSRKHYCVGLGHWSAMKGLHHWLKFFQPNSLAFSLLKRQEKKGFWQKLRSLLMTKRLGT